MIDTLDWLPIFRAVAFLAMIAVFAVPFFWWFWDSHGFMQRLSSTGSPLMTIGAFMALIAALRSVWIEAALYAALVAISAVLELRLLLRRKSEG